MRYSPLQSVILPMIVGTGRRGSEEVAEEAGEPPAPASGDVRRGRLWRAGILIGLIGVLWIPLGVIGVGYLDKLSAVQKNDSSSYLPRSAESTKVDSESGLFQSVHAIPGFVVYQRPGGLTAADRAAIVDETRVFRSIRGVLASQSAFRS